jgi:heptosyltransferase-2
VSGDAPKAVLVIQTAFIGDVVLAIPLLKAISHLWPETRLDVMVRPPSDNLLETLSCINQIIVYDKYGSDRGAAALYHFGRRLRLGNYDVVFCPHRSFRSGLLAYLSDAKRRIGFARGGGLIFHSKRIPYPRQIHEIRRNLKLLNSFSPDIAVEIPEIPPTDEDTRFVDEALKPFQGSRVVALAPGSVWYTKRWPEEYFIDLSSRCIAAGYKLVLIGGGEDRDLGDRIAAATGDHCLNLAGKTSLRQSVELLRRSEILLTNDSAPTHLGTAAGTRVLTIFGSTVPEFGFAPYGRKGKSLGIDLDCRPCTDHGRQSCPEKHLHCLKDIIPDTVFAEMERMIAEIDP